MNQSTHSAVAILDCLDGAPGPARFDQLGLVQAVDGLGQRVVIGAADGADRGLDPGFGEPLGEPDRRVLRPAIRMVDNIFESNRPSRWRVQMACSMASSTIEVAIVEAAPPAQDPPGVGVDDERDVDPARPRRYIGEVGHPQPVGRRRPELPPHQVGWPGPAGSAIVVRLTLPRTAPSGRARAISRSTVQRATLMPSRLSASHTLRAPYTP